MSQPVPEEEDEKLPPVLTASIHDIRYLSALLRGVSFVNRATVTVTQSGLVVTVEEARTLLATAYVFSDIFDEYTYTPPPVSASQPGPSQADSESDPEDPATALEIPLTTLIECLNIFGTAGSTAASTASKTKKWHRAEDEPDPGDGGGSGGAASGKGRIDSFFSAGGEKKTGMRMSYEGAGYPLTMLIAEDTSGPTATCEITTYAAEPHLDLPFDTENTVLKVILKSSWLRDALSEVDPSCDKLTFLGNPPPPDGQAGNAQPRAAPQPSKPMLRIQILGAFGSTEMDYPNDREVLETFECAEPVKFSYRFGHISRTLRALQNSTKTSLRIDREGLLALQFLMPSPKPRGGTSDAFIEFRCLPLDESAV